MGGDTKQRRNRAASPPGQCNVEPGSLSSLSRCSWPVHVQSAQVCPGPGPWLLSLSALALAVVLVVVVLVCVLGGPRFAHSNQFGRRLSVNVCMCVCLYVFGFAH